jgi:hypothetical protein
VFSRFGIGGVCLETHLITVKVYRNVNTGLAIPVFADLDFVRLIARLRRQDHKHHIGVLPNRTRFAQESLSPDSPVDIVVLQTVRRNAPVKRRLTGLSNPGSLTGTASVLGRRSVAQPACRSAAWDQSRAIFRRRLVGLLPKLN